MKRLLIRNGTVVDPSQGLHRALDILVVDGVVSEISSKLSNAAADTIVDATGMHVMPGFIDIHTHLREPGGEGSETIETGTAAAAAGGFTTIYCMPNTQPVCDSETGVQYVVSRAKSHGSIRVVPVASITKGMLGEELTNFGRLLDSGAGAFSDDGRPIMNAEIMRRALEYTKLLNIPIFEHCEDLNLTGEGQINEGIISARLGLKGIPRVSESVMVARNAALAAMTGGHFHVCHVSTRESVEAIREAKRNGVRITAEVSPHHLTMTEDAVLNYNTNAKMKPPVCEKADRNALIAALEDGTIDCIATDHAPHSAQSKDNVFDAAPFGIIGMETAFPVLYTAFVARKKWSLDFLVEKMTTAPARVVDKPWGTLAPGAQADITILELGKTYKFERKHLRSRSFNCPWLGSMMKARVVATYFGGERVFSQRDCDLPVSESGPPIPDLSQKIPAKKRAKSR